MLLTSWGFNQILKNFKKWKIGKDILGKGKSIKAYDNETKKSKEESRRSEKHFIASKAHTVHVTKTIGNGCLAAHNSKGESAAV